MFVGKIKLPQERQGDRHKNQPLDVAGLESDAALCQHWFVGAHRLY